MGCCCRGDATYPPDEPPVPPPRCELLFSTLTIRKLVTRSTGTASVAAISAANDQAWTDFGTASFGYVFGSQPASLARRNVQYLSGVHWNDTQVGKPKGAAYLEDRLLVFLSLNDGLGGVGGTQRSLRELYGVSSLGLSLAGTVFGSGTSGSLVMPYFGGNHTVSYSTTWTTIDVHWALVPSTSITITNGATDVATNTLASGLAVSGTDAVFEDFKSSSVVIPLSSVIDETGEDYLLLVLKVPDAAIVKQGVTITGINQSDASGVQQTGAGYAVLPNSPSYQVQEIWGCIKTITVRTQIEQATSSIVEEDRTKVCTYVSGQNLTKRFRSIDNTPGGGMSLSEDLILTNTVDGDNWLSPDPSGLDNDTDFPAIPSAAGQVTFEEADEDTSQSYDLSAVTLAHETGSITATVYAYVADPTATFKMDFELYVGGAWTAVQQVQWDDAVGAYKTAVLATGKSVSDFSGAKLRLTPREHGGGDDDSFELIKVRLESTGSADVERTLDVYLTESAGSYYLTFGYLRETDPNDSTYYVGRQTTPFVDTVALGDTGRATIGDLIGTDIVFAHDGDDNDDTGNGTEDATITFTITDIAI